MLQLAKARIGARCTVFTLGIIGVIKRILGSIRRIFRQRSALMGRHSIKMHAGTPVHVEWLGVIKLDNCQLDYRIAGNFRGY